jgi:hypothetical protein
LYWSPETKRILIKITLVECFSLQYYLPFTLTFVSHQYPYVVDVIFVISPFYYATFFAMYLGQAFENSRIQEKFPRNRVDIVPLSHEMPSLKVKSPIVIRKLLLHYCFPSLALAGL